MRPSDRTRARHLLEHRTDGFSIIRVVRRSLVGYLILAAAAGMVIALWRTSDRPVVRAACLWTGGMFCGAVLRDFGWLFRIKRAWPLTEKFTDWPTVEMIAAGRDPADADHESRNGRDRS